MIDLRDVFYNDDSDMALYMRQRIITLFNRLEYERSKSNYSIYPIRLNTGMVVYVGDAVSVETDMLYVPVIVWDEIIAYIDLSLVAFVEKYSSSKFLHIYDAVIEYYEQYPPMKKFRRISIRRTNNDNRN